MKKIIARLGVNSEERDPSGNASAFNALIGRQVNVGGRSVVIEELIAEGGFGVVFKVRDLSQRHYALKRLCVNSDENLSRCKQEVNILKSINHKNVVRLVDAGIVRNQNGVCEIMILLQYCRDSVTDLIEQALSRRNSLQEQTVLRIFCDICEAVGCLHEQNIIHRDLKLENVLIDDNGNYVLCDFGSATKNTIIPKNYGISKTEEEISKYTTLAYRAPEMVDLYAGMEISTKADIWALGCLLYTLCFLKLPFKDSALAIQSGEYSVPDYHDYGDNIVKLIGYMLHLDPVRRPDIYQVSALAFQMTSDCVSPLRNINNSVVPKFEDLPLPTKESEVKSKTSSKVSVPAPTMSSEPVKTSVKPRQRPRVCGTTQSLNLSNLVPPSDQPSRGNSLESSREDDLYSLPPPPLGDDSSRDVRCDNKVKTSPPLVSASGDQTDNSPSIAKKASPLINLTGEESMNNYSKEPPGGCLPRQFSENLAPTKSAAEPLGVSSTSLLDLDLLSFDSPKPAVPMTNQSATGLFPGPSFQAVGAGRGQQPVSGPMHSRAGHRRLMSDTSAITPNHNFSGNYMRPPPPTRISQMPQWGPPRFGLPAQQPLTASVSMDYIRFAGVMHQQQQAVGNYQLPPQMRMPLQQQQWAHGQSHYMPVPPPMVQTPKPHANVDQNPHHQWKHPLRGNRPLSSSSADLINLTTGSVKPDQSALHQKPVHQLAVGTKSMPTTNLLNNRTTSAVELDAFGSVPFSTM